MSLINAFLATGRDLAEAEADLFRSPLDDPRRAALARRASQLQHHQTDQIAVALRHGVTEETIRFALTMHGQGANRDPFRTDPTPAEQLLGLIQSHGPERFAQALDATRAASPTPATTEHNTP